LDWGGAQIYYFGLMKLVRQYYPVRAVMPAGSAERLLQYLARLEIPVEFFDANMGRAANSFGDRLRRRWEKIRCEWTIARYLGGREGRRTLLHLDISPWNSFCLLAYLSMRAQVFVTLHTAVPPVSTLRQLSWFAKFRLLGLLPGFHLLTSNRDALESLRPFVSDASLRRIPIAYSGIDVEEIEQAAAVPVDRGELCRRYGLPEDGILVFTVGQFIERKGCRILLEAARELRAEHPRLFFVWIGTRELDAEAERLIADSGVSDRFRHLSAREVGDRLSLLTLLRLADLFVLPSLYEGLPIALLEAMALEKACIASAVNAIPEAIRNDQTGLLVPAGDGGALAEAISELAQNEPLRRRLAAAARRLVLEQFDERVTAGTTLAYYEACGGELG
jgi:glycosyltransferase involved in cell wall biosynthesis